jgi:hypothetical protein
MFSAQCVATRVIDSIATHAVGISTRRPLAYHMGVQLRCQCLASMAPSTRCTAATRKCITPCKSGSSCRTASTAEQVSTYANYIVDSGWKTTGSGALRNGANSWNWIAKVTFTVPGPGPAVLIASDRNFVSELVAIFDETGTTVSGSGLISSGAVVI